ncbi:hypothetical protein N7495_007422 [Penicillium taxi]|uniref:uncharacterized protein n=1 Tax=Penicillium taxi TaxID=168475 RepID=UPI0025457B18|nr:uncharacterized protein N7495_007422 [Penicillium taxi]KAJ5887381.1 hypothetical protein N7495_007422 [Penicillium taxi]
MMQFFSVALLATITSALSVSNSARSFSTSPILRTTTTSYTSTSTSTTSSSTSTYTTSSSSTSTTTTTSSPSCTAGDTSTTTGVDAIIDSTGFVRWLDVMLNTLPDGESDWVNQLWLNTFPNEGASPLSGCSEIGGDCSPDDLCSVYPSQLQYWVFHEIYILHSKINMIHEQLLWTGWLDSLSIDQIGKDFTTITPAPVWAKWIAAAFSMAGSFASTVEIGTTQLRGMIGFTGSAFTEVGLTSTQSDKVDTTTVEDFLKSVVESAGDYIAEILTNATGNGDSSYLPIHTDSDATHYTAKFLNDDTIMLDINKDNSSLASAYEYFIDNLVSSC